MCYSNQASNIDFKNNFWGTLLSEPWAWFFKYILRDYLSSFYWIFQDSNRTFFKLKPGFSNGHFNLNYQKEFEILKSVFQTDVGNDFWGTLGMNFEGLREFQTWILAMNLEKLELALKGLLMNSIQTWMVDFNIEFRETQIRLST